MLVPSPNEVTLHVPHEAAWQSVADWLLAQEIGPGTVILLQGNLGAGKTTFVRYLLRTIGHAGEVRSPTFNLYTVYNTNPPVLHADLYRVQSADGIGLEDFLDSHLIVVEWPDRLTGFLNPTECWMMEIGASATGEGRTCNIYGPTEPSPAVDPSSPE